MKPKLDERTGEHIDNVFAGTRTTYYIPFTKIVTLLKTFC
jgi:hypothetical protein